MGIADTRGYRSERTTPRRGGTGTRAGCYRGSRAALFVARYVALRRSVSLDDSGPLSEVEKRGLKASARRTKLALSGVILFVILDEVLLAVTNPAPL